MFYQATIDQNIDNTWGQQEIDLHTNIGPKDLIEI